VTSPNLTLRAKACLATLERRRAMPAIEVEQIIKCKSMNQQRAVAFAALVSVLLSGCTASSPARQAKQEQFQRTVPTCEGQADCNAKWEAAQLWVVHNAGYKIQTATSVLIETYNPGQYGAELAARVTKEPIGSGRYMLVVQTWCNNIFGCVTNPLDAALDFNAKVASVVP